MADLYRGMGGTFGFGDAYFAPNDDGSSSEIDITNVFGAEGLNFFGTYHTSLYINNNGNITFGSPLGAFTPYSLTGATALPIIAAYFADVDTRADETGLSPTPGGTSQGSDLVWMDFDDVNGILTVTWDDVGVFNQNISERNAFQMRLIDRGYGDFDIEFIYEDIQWHTGEASSGSPARAGFNSGDGVNYYELAASGDIPALLSLPETVGTGSTEEGIFRFEVRSGAITFVDAVEDFFDANHGDIVSGSVLDDNGGGVDENSDSSPIIVTDFAGGTLAGGSATLASGAVVSVAEDGSFSYDSTNVGGWVGEDSFDYSIIDPDRGDVDTATVTITYQDTYEGIIEFGEMELGNTRQTISLINTYVDPVVVAFVATTNRTDPVAVRVRSIGTDQMSLQLQEPAYLDGTHPEETVRYIVAERGAWILPDGTRFQAGLLESDMLTSEGTEQVTFKDGFFDDEPAVFSQVMSKAGSAYVSARHLDADADGFRVAMQESEADNDGGHLTEDLGWIAFETGTFTINGAVFEVGTTGAEVGSAGTTVALGNSFAGGAHVVAQLASLHGADPAHARGISSDETSFTLFAEEDQSLDSETGHLGEQVSYLAFGETTSLPAEIHGATAGSVTESGTITLPTTLQDITLSLTAPDASAQATETVTGLITEGSVAAGGNANVAFVIDVSGSVADNFSGSTTVGDWNGDGISDTILDAEIAGFSAFIDSLVSNGLGGTMINLIAFSSGASSAYTGIASADVDGNGIFDAVDAAMTFSATGQTYFNAALDEAVDFFESSAPISGGSNYVFFLSDGYPNGGSYSSQVSTLLDATGINAEIRAFGVGGGASEAALDLVDDGINNATATIVLDPSELASELVDGGGVDPADILAVGIQVNGVLQETIDVSALVATPFGLSFAADVALDISATDTVTAVLALDEDRDGVVDSYLWVDQIIEQLDQTPVVTFGSEFYIRENETEIGRFSAFDPEGAALSYSISGGADQALFTLDGATGDLAFLSAQDYEAPGDADGDNVFDIEVEVSDGTTTTVQDVEVRVTDVDDNSAPSLFVDQVLFSVEETTSLSGPLKVADIYIVDDASSGAGGNVLSLGAEDAALFEIVGTELFLRAGVSIDYETLTTLDVRVKVDDASIGTTPDDYVDLVVAIEDVNEVIEFGELSLRTDPVTVSLQNSYDDPVVVAFVSTANGGAPVVVRVDEVTEDTLTLRLQEPGYLDNVHAAETVRFIVAERGAWELPDGTHFQAGIVDSNLLTSAGFASVGFKADLFDDTPAVFSQVQTSNGADWVTTRMRNTDTGGFDVAMQEAELHNGGNHAPESIGWIAFDTGVFDIAGQTFEIGTTPRSVSQDTTTVDLVTDFDSEPNVMAQMAGYAGADSAVLRMSDVGTSEFDVWVQEDQSADSETGHSAEAISYIAFEENTALPADEIPLDPPTAIDDTFVTPDCVLESEGTGDIDGYVLLNDLNPDGFPLDIVEVGDGYGVGEWVPGSDGGRFRINADGSLDFDAASDFEYLGAGETAITQVTYDLGFEGPAESFDVVLLQDLSGSFGDDLANVQAQFPDVADYFATYYDAQFGVSTFVDKPFSPFGNSSDYVYETDLSITADLTSLSDTINGLSIYSGNDGPEAQLEALLQLAARADGEVGYRDGAQRFVVISTDAGWHEAGDYGSAPANDGDDLVEDEDYPSIEQVAVALDDANITPIFLVTSGVMSSYESLVSDFGFGQVVELTSDSSNLAEAIEDALDTAEGRSRATVSMEVCGENDAPQFVTSTAQSIDENHRYVTSVAATDAEGDAITYRISGGIDASFFSIDADTGVLTMDDNPDFETIRDFNHDNIYKVRVAASDGLIERSLLLEVEVNDINETPIFTSEDEFYLFDGATEVGTLSAYDPDAGDVLTWALSGLGPDDALFDIDPTTGLLTKTTPFSLGSPEDADADGLYSVIAQVFDDAGRFDLMGVTIGLDPFLV